MGRSNPLATLAAAPPFYITPRGDRAAFALPEDATAAALTRPAPSADWMAWSNYASALNVIGRSGAAEIAARRALRRERNATTLLNLAVILETRGDFTTALRLASAAHDADPADPYAACLYSDALLRIGDFASAWPLYTRSHADWSWFSRIVPEWDGLATSLAHRRLLVLPGGGFGDNILFARWLPFLAALGADVTYVCPPSFAPLIAHRCGVHRTVAGSISGLDGAIVPSEYDLFTCILSLGQHFCPTPQDIPLAPYLFAKPDPRATRRHTLLHGAIPRVGICIRAGEESSPRRHRSLNPAQAQRLIRSRRKDVDWIHLSPGFRLQGATNPGIRNWGDTAALVASLDLVVTVDTGVAHLAGALGVPCWVILPGISAPYYGTAALNGSGSPFYPSQRLFRNGASGLDAAIAQLIAALETWRPDAAQ